MGNKTINISLPGTILDAADKQAELEFRNRSELIREALRVYLLQRNSMSENSFSKAESKRVREILNFGDFKNQRLIIASCVFRPQPNDIPNLFEGESAPVIKLLEKPPHFRYAGWDLQTLDRAKPVAGEFLQVTNGEIKIIRIFRDGQIVLAGNENFFGHGVNKDKDSPFAFNGLAVAELLTNFVNFAEKLAHHLKIGPIKVIFKIQVLNPKKEPVLLINAARGHPWSQKAGEINLDLADREVLVSLDKNFKLEKAAYKLLAEFFYFFGLKEDQFWYVKKEGKEVDIEFFKQR